MLRAVKTARRSLSRQNVQVKVLRIPGLIALGMTKDLEKVSVLFQSAHAEEHCVVGCFPQRCQTFQFSLNEHLFLMKMT